MNELEKKDLPEQATELPEATVSETLSEEVEAPQAEAAEETAVPAAESVTVEKVCIEASPDACAETESPAESLSAAADAQQEAVEDEAENIDDVENASNADDNPRRFHNMSKEELVAAIKEVLDTDSMESHREVASMKQAFFNIRNRERMEELNSFVDAGNAPEAFVSTPDPLEQEFNDLVSVFKERRAAYLAADEAKRAANLAKKNEILAQMMEIAGDIDTVNVKFAEFKQLQQDFRDIKEIPASAETESWKNFQTISEQFYDHLKMNKDLRDLDFKKNLEAKKMLISDAKALAEVSDPVLAFRKLQSLHEDWRNLGPVAKEYRESLWEEFREASAVINRRYQDYFEQRKAAEQVNEEAKTKLCEEVEALDFSKLNSFAAWNQMTEQIIEIQKKWKEYGYASKKANSALYTRFRKACDAFFEAKTEYFHKTREGFSENLARKIALCEKAEALKDNSDVKNPTAEIVKLQAEWRTIGSVPRKQSDEVWNRFQTACNYFFDERKKQQKERRSQENEALEKKRAIIAQLKELPLDGDRREVIGRVKELQSEWNDAGFVPFKLKDQIFKEYREVCDLLYNTYNDRESRQRMNHWQERVGKMKGEGQKLGSEREKLQRALEGKKNELLTIENNMGFFNVKSSAGNSLVRDMERKIARLREDIEEIRQKIKLLDAEQ